jgi:hypothetical protein
MTLKVKETTYYKVILRLWEEKPLTIIFFLAIFFRLIAVLFAKGWGMLDDHFLVVESAQSWVDGKDSDYWLPGSPGNTGPTGHNFFYPGLQFLLFSFFRLIHLNDPQLKMMIVRLLHASWSLVTIFFGYKITRKLGTGKDAKIVGLLLAIYWFMPWVSVRNMVEVFCIPFLMMATWRIIRDPEEGQKLSDYFIAGLFLGLAFNIRIQTVFFSVGLGLSILLNGRWKEVLVMAFGALVPIILIQGMIDTIIWGTPFVEMAGYIKGNIVDATSYITSPWYQYFLVVLGFLLPPVSFFLFYGFLRCWKKQIILFLPVTVFFLFHSIFPNKQERFILPVLPFIIISGVIGWNQFLENVASGRRKKNEPVKGDVSVSGKLSADKARRWSGLIRGCWIFFWIVNLVLLVTISTMYSKRSRVEAMTYLSKYHDISYFMVLDENNSMELFPMFYLGQWPETYDELLEGENCDSLMIRVSKEPFQKQPRFILFTAETDLNRMVVKARKKFPYIVYETTIEPGYIDKIVKWLNPINKNRKVYIYRNTIFYPKKIG